jgi:predicted membrane-bound spermidine synthase
MKKIKKKEVTPEELERKISNQLLLFLAFIEGGSVIAIELLGAKMLTPFFGNSLLIWTSILGVTITFLTIGYLIGGKLSNRNNLIKLLSYLFLLASSGILLMPSWAFTLLTITSETDLYIGCVIAASLLIGPPLLLLATTSPLIIQLINNNLSSAGKSAGSVYAISTLGGIIFTFGIGFIAIPIIGITLPIIITSIILIGLSLFIYFEKFQLLIVFASILFFMNFYSSQGASDSQDKLSVKMISEGMGGQLKVVDFTDTNTGIPLRMLMVNGIAQTVIVNNPNAYSWWPYIHKTSMLASLKRGSKNVLLLGLGGGSIASELVRLNMEVDAIELEPRIVPIAEKYFYFDNSKVNIIIDDARHFIQKTKKKYDLIIFDVLNSEVQPSYIFTEESFKNLKNILNDDGLILIEFQEIDEKKDLYAYKSICNTLLKSGYHTYYSQFYDLIIMASPTETDFSKLNPENFTECCKMQPWDVNSFLLNPAIKVEVPFKDGVILTDDKPILDFLNAKTIKNWREGSIRDYSQSELKQNKKLFR